jgi:hypothetical protein
MLLCAGALAATGQSAFAANDLWIGNTDANFGTAANWTGSVAPSGNTPEFGVAGTSGTALNNDISGAAYVGILFDSGASAYTITGNAFNLTGAITNNAAGVEETFNTDVVISGSTWNLAAGTTTTFNGALSAAANTATILFGGTTAGTTGGTVNLNGTSTLDLSGGAFRALILQGTGTSGTTLNVGNGSNSASLTINSTAANSGWFNVNNGSTLNVKSGASVTVNGTTNATAPTTDIGNVTGAAATVNIDGTLTYGTGTSLRIGFTSGTDTGVVNVKSGGVLNLNGAARSVTIQSAGVLNVAGTVNSSEGTWAGNGKLVLQGGTFKATAAQTLGNTLAISTTSASSTIDTNGNAVSIGSGISGSGGLVKNGLGTLTLSGTNTFTGNTVVNAGTLSLATNVSLDDSIVLSLATGTTLGLDFASGSETVFALVLNGSSVTPGTYTSDQLNALASGVSFTSLGGTLTVTSAVPEPGTVALLVLGFGGLVFVIRRRNQQA